MKIGRKSWQGWVALWASILLTAMAATAAEKTTPVRIIFDTDMDTDCDDVGALAILHALADAGEAEILATVVSSRHRWSAPCVASLNAYYGRPELPIGIPKSKAKNWDRRGSKYAQIISEEFPAAKRAEEEPPDAVAIYRRILAGQPDGSVVIVSVGDLTNPANLLDSKADDSSPLTGRELAQRKVKLWVCMGGRYPNHLEPGVFGNFKPDPEATVQAARDWPGTLLFTGLGDEIMTGGRLPELPAKHPVRRAYEIYLNGKTLRPSWDPIAVLYAVRPNLPFWEIHKTGRNHIFDNGTNEWREGPATNHQLLLLKTGAEKQLRDALDQLMIQPPKDKHGAP